MTKCLQFIENKIIIEKAINRKLEEIEGHVEGRELLQEKADIAVPVYPGCGH